MPENYIIVLNLIFHKSKYAQRTYSLKFIHLISKNTY